MNVLERALAFLNANSDFHDIPEQRDCLWGKFSFRESVGKREPGTYFSWFDAAHPFREEGVFNICKYLTLEEDLFIEFMLEIASKLEPDISDPELIRALYDDHEQYGLLAEMIEKWAPRFWPDFGEDLREAICSKFYQVITWVFHDYENQCAALGDPYAMEEDQVFHYLHFYMGLPIASCCGILANVLCASNFTVTLSHIVESGYVGFWGFDCYKWDWEIDPDFRHFCTARNYAEYAMFSHLEFLARDVTANHPNFMAALENASDSPIGAKEIAKLFYEEYRGGANANDRSRIMDLAENYYWPKYAKYTATGVKND